MTILRMTLAASATALVLLLGIAACEDRTGGDTLTRPGLPIPEDAGPERDVPPVFEGGLDAGSDADGATAYSCPAGSTPRNVRVSCAGTPLTPPAQLVADLADASPGDVVSLAGMNESEAPCLPVVVCTPSEAPTMLFSDSPEMPSQDGILYADTVKPGRYRFYLYHANGGAALRKFPIVVLNQGIDAAKITISRRGLGAPGTSYVAIGKSVLLDWMSDRAAVDVTVPPGQRVLLDPALDALHAAQGELVHAIYDVTVDKALKISFVSVGASADAPAVTAGLPLLARDVDHQRGTFTNADVLVATAAVPGGAQKSGVQRLRLGLDEVDETLEGNDATTGVKQRLLGNYGMVYHLALGLPANASTAISPRGGAWGGAMRTLGVDGGAGLVALPSGSTALGTTTDAIVVGPSSLSKEIRLVSAGGSNLPIDVFFVTP
ncbi:MAG: hypothetical protein JST00_41620 [Deltaproteobacteria bacterium]|nr:hypothetical protein [Deltaproteobacteria bacterium]